MAIDAFDVGSRHGGGLGRIVDAGVAGDVVTTSLCQLGSDILGRHRTAMADQAIGLFHGIVEDARPAARRVRPVAVLAGIAGDRGPAGVLPGVGAGAGPGLGRGAVVAGGPVVLGVAGDAQGGGGVVHRQELAVGVVVCVVAGGALHPAAGIQADRAGEQQQRRRVGQLDVQGAQGGVIDEGDRVVVAQVDAEIVGTGGQCRHPSRHGDVGRPVAHLAEGDGAVMAAQTQHRGAVGLSGRALQCGTGVGRIRRAGQSAIPQRGHPGL